MKNPRYRVFKGKALSMPVFSTNWQFLAQCYVRVCRRTIRRTHFGRPGSRIFGKRSPWGKLLLRGITEAELEHAVNWHFTLDGLQAASDRVVRLMDRLELPNLARRLPDRLHTSSDGQKFEVRVDSLNANYSFKYFGKEQGVAAYTFRDERDLLWYSCGPP
jgi:Tn3 transposase DDE domain